MEQQLNTCPHHQGEQFSHCCLNSSCTQNRLACADCMTENRHSAHSVDLIKYRDLNSRLFQTKAADCEKMLQKQKNIFDELSDLFNDYLQGIRIKYIIQAERFDLLSVDAKLNVINKILSLENLKTEIEASFFTLPNLLLIELEKKIKDLQLEKIEYFHIGDNQLEIYNERLNRGVNLFAQEQFQEAEKQFGKSLRINPQNPQAICWKGEALLKLNKFAEADETFQLALTFEKKNIKALYGRSLCLRALNRISEAVEFCIKVIEINSGFMNAKEMLEQMLAWMEAQ